MRHSGSTVSVLDTDNKSSSSFMPLFEMLHIFEYRNKRFTYTLHSYINGYLAIEEKWKLIRN